MLAAVLIVAAAYPGVSLARLVAATPTPTDNVEACGESARAAIARIRRDTHEIFRFRCADGVVREFWISSSGRIKKEWKSFVAKNGDLFEFQPHGIRRSDRLGGFVQVWNGLDVRDAYLFERSQSRKAGSDLDEAIVSRFYDTREVHISSSPQVSRVTAKAEALKAWQCIDRKNFRIGDAHLILVMGRKDRLGISQTHLISPYLGWYFEGADPAYKHIPGAETCTVDAATGKVLGPLECGRCGGGAL